MKTKSTIFCLLSVIRLTNLAAILTIAATFHPIASFALTQDDVLFYAPLDGGLDAVTAKGKAYPVGSSKIRFTEGYKGQGILVGGEGMQVDYSTAGNIDMEAGTVSMWVKPVDWGSDTYNRPFFGISEAGSKGEGNFLWLYKYFIYSTFWLVQQQTPQQSVYFVTPTSGDRGGLISFDWQEGKWGHLSASWSGNQLYLHINGQFVGTAYVTSKKILRDFADIFTIGGKNGRGEGTPDTVIDDVLILRRPITGEEAKSLYEHGLNSLTQQSASNAPYFIVRTGYNPAEDKTNLTSQIAGRHMNELAKMNLSYSIRSTSGTKALKTGKLNPSTLSQSWKIDSSTLPVGKYVLSASLYENGKIISTTESEFEKKPKPEWLGNKLGKANKVPKQWTPIYHKGNTLTCWGRSYTWDDSLFPSQITTQGQQLLARPVNIRARINGREYPLTGGKVEWVKVSPDRAFFVAEGDLNGIPVKIDGWLEYDGFLWTTTHIGGKGSKSRSLESLAIEIPLRKEYATLMQGRLPVPAPGKVRPFSGPLAYSPVIWLGNEKGGLQWSTESMKNWQLKDKSKMAELRTDSKETVLCLTLVDQPTKLDKPIQFTMGLHATPVKPVDQNFRAWEMELNNINCNAQNGRNSWAYFWSQWNRRGKNTDGPYGYLIPTENTYKDIETFKAEGKIPWIYWHMHAVWAGDPVLKMFSDWGEYQDESKAHPYAYATADRTIPAIRDYQIWLMWKMLSDNPDLSSKIKGIYLDVAQSMLGNIAVQGTRDLQKRFYNVLKDGWPNLLISNHQSGDMDMFQLSFSDVMLSGEHLAEDPNLKKDKAYYHMLDLDALRAEYNWSQFGIPIIFLPEVIRAVEGDKDTVAEIESEKGIPASEHLVGMLWVHDIVPWAVYINTKPFIQAGKAKDKFGWDGDTQLIGYWESNNLVQTRTDKSPVVTSVFKRKDRVMFVVMNNSDEDAVVELRPDWKALELAPRESLTDAYIEQSEKPIDPKAITVPVLDGEAKIVVKARNFKALVAR